MSEEKRLMIENDLCMNKSKAQVIKLYLDLLDDDIKQKEVLDKIKEKCLSIKGNPEHTIVSKNELVKQFLELLEKIE